MLSLFQGVGALVTIAWKLAHLMLIHVTLPLLGIAICRPSIAHPVATTYLRLASLSHNADG